MTPNLQTPLTVKNAARLMNVAERSVFMAKAVWRLLPDLGREFAADRMSVAEAFVVAARDARSF